MSHKIQIADSNISFVAEDGETISQAAEKNGVLLTLGCRMGACGACKSKLCSGEVNYSKKPLALTEEDKKNGMILLCTAVPASDLVIEAKNARRTKKSANQFDVKIVKIVKVSDDILSMTIERVDGQKFDFEAGQVINILLPNGDSRSYSFASPAVQQTTADLYIRHVSNGLFTGLLFNGAVKEGNVLKAEAPFGTFTFNTTKDKKAVFLVTGTGIAPVMSILRTLKANDDLKDRDISLFWGVRHAKDLAFLSELESLAESYPAFKFYPVVSKDENWPGLKGRITKHAAEIIGDFTDCDAYLCGSTPMVNSVTDYLFVRCGLKEDRTFSDAFGG